MMDINRLRKCLLRKIFNESLQKLRFYCRSYIKQFERTNPDLYFRYSANTDTKFVDIDKERNPHVYEPRLDAFKYGWKNSKMISRIGRVCKVRQMHILACLVYFV